MGQKVTLTQFAAILEALPDKVEKQAVRALRRTGMRLMVLVEYHIRNNVPPLVDRGRLVQSTTLIPTARGCIIRVDAPHAAPLEYGARPFMPPLQPLVDWARRKGFSDPEGIARAIRWKFYRHGMKPRRFFARALEDLKASGTLGAEVRKAMAPKDPAP